MTGARGRADMTPQNQILGTLSASGAATDMRGNPKDPQRSRRILGPSKPIQQAPRKESPLERHLAASILAAGLPSPEREFKFHETRQWRVDFCWPDVALAVEIEGGAFRGPGHRSVGVFLANIEKYNALTMAGYRLLRFHGDQVKSGEAVELIRRALAVTVGEAGEQEE